jgi:hypothetical protein
MMIVCVLNRLKVSDNWVENKSSPGPSSGDQPSFGGAGVGAMLVGNMATIAEDTELDMKSGDMRSGSVIMSMNL